MQLKLLKYKRLIKNLWCKLQKVSTSLIIDEKCIRNDVSCLIKMGVLPLTGVPLLYFPG